MKILYSWLRDYVDPPVEAEEMGRDLSLVGLELGGFLKHGKDDAVLDFEVTTNRVDCMNVYGIAREVSALYDVPLRPLDTSVRESGSPAQEAWQVATFAADLCPRFCGRVLDVSVRASPQWLRDRLEAVGERPISNLVDLTNYVMMEMGQPSHAFDLARIPGHRIHVRWARAGERVKTLDGNERTLDPRVGVVAGEDGPLGLAGIMGGASSEVSGETRTVALEAAYWEPLAIRRAAKALGMHTEASHRFERGADPEAPRTALDRIAHLLLKMEAGTVRPGVIDVQAAPRRTRTTVLRPARLDAVLGTPVPPARTLAILSRLGFEKPEGGAPGAYAIPTWRGDVTREIDVIEEVGRIHGLDKISSTVPPSRRAEGLRASQQAERLLRDVLVGAGLSEVVNYAFVSPTDIAGAVPTEVALENPLSEEQSVLRSSLVMPGLLSTLRVNARQGRRDVGVFEVGRVFSPGGTLPVEELRLGILLAGARTGAHWSGARQEADFFDVKGILEALVARLGVPSLEWSREGLPGLVHPGQAAAVRLDGRVIGYAGALHPALQGAWELKEGAMVAEIALDPLLQPVRAAVRATSLPRFPAVDRDLSVVVPQSTAVHELEAAVREAAGPLLRSVRVTDRYDRPPVPPAHVSLTLALVYQDAARTLTGDEVQASMTEVTRALLGRGFTIRGE